MRASAARRSRAGYYGPVLGDPSRDAAAHIVDAPVSRLPVQHAGDPEAALSAMTERVRALVKQIRAKLGDDAANPTWIFNERGVGYRMAKPGEE